MYSIILCILIVFFFIAWVYFNSTKKEKEKGTKPLEDLRNSLVVGRTYHVKEYVSTPAGDTYVHCFHCRIEDKIKRVITTTIIDPSRMPFVNNVRLIFNIEEYYPRISQSGNTVEVSSTLSWKFYTITQS